MSAMDRQSIQKDSAEGVRTSFLEARTRIIQHLCVHDAELDERLMEECVRNGEVVEAWLGLSHFR
jgi:hypothetical protein